MIQIEGDVQRWYGTKTLCCPTKIHHALSTVAAVQVETGHKGTMRQLPVVRQGNAQHTWQWVNDPSGKAGCLHLHVGHLLGHVDTYSIWFRNCKSCTNNSFSKAVFWFTAGYSHGGHPLPRFNVLQSEATEGDHRACDNIAHLDRSLGLERGNGFTSEQPTYWKRVPMYLSTRLATCLSRFNYLSAHICLSICLASYLSIYLPLSPSRILSVCIYLLYLISQSVFIFISCLSAVYIYLYNLFRIGIYL